MSTRGRGTSAVSPADRVFARFLSGEHLLKVDGDQPGCGLAGLVPHAVPVAYREGGTLPCADESQDGVLAFHVLECIADYRRALAEWFRVLRTGGFLVVVVPHQFLFERKLSPPSRFDRSHKRFYTAASLLLEIEEALDPQEFRVRHLEDNDSDFDYGAPPEVPPVGCSEIVVVLERMRRPDYADAVLEDVQAKSEFADEIAIARTPDAADGPTVCIRSTPCRAGRIAVLKLDHRGDFILATPAMRELRRLFPSAALTLICGQWNASAAAGLGIFDRILPFDFYSESGKPELRPAPRRLIKDFAALVSGMEFDLAIDLRVDPDTRHLLREIDADQRAGFGDLVQFPFLDIALPFVNPTASSSWCQIGAEQFQVNVGTREDDTVVFRGNPYFDPVSRTLLRSPAVEAGPGHCSVVVDIDMLDKEFEVWVGVYVSDGTGVTKQWRRRTVRELHPLNIEFHLSQAAKIEILICSRGFRRVRPFRFRGCRLARRGEWQGPHQQELMFMLASVVGLRMNNPFRIEE